MDLLSGIKNHITLYEGLRLKPYTDTTGHLTIGYGTNLDAGISKEAAVFMRDEAIEKSIEDLQTMIFCGIWHRFPNEIKLVFIDMRYNLGRSGFRGFKNMIMAAVHFNWPAVKREMMDSKWYNQVGVRGIRLVEIVDEVIG